MSDKSDNKISIDYTYIKNKISSINNVISSFESNVSKVSSNQAYNVLQSAGLDNGFSNEFDTGIQSLVSNLKTVFTSINNAVGNLESTEEYLIDEMPDVPSNKFEEEEKSEKVDAATAGEDITHEEVKKMEDKQSEEQELEDIDETDKDELEKLKEEEQKEKEYDDESTIKEEEQLKDAGDDTTEKVELDDDSTVKKEDLEEVKTDESKEQKEDEETKDEKEEKLEDPTSSTPTQIDTDEQVTYCLELFGLVDESIFNKIFDNLSEYASVNGLSISEIFSNTYYSATIKNEFILGCDQFDDDILSQFESFDQYTIQKSLKKYYENNGKL